MTGTSILCVALLAGAPGPVDKMVEYQAAAAKVGRDAAAHVRLALWCERHGLEAERLKHLSLAVLIDPDNATARGLLGFVRDGAGWRRPEAVAERLRSDPALAEARAEYEAKRTKTPDRAEDQWKLALWCEEQGLGPEATAHLAAVVRLDPSRELAWKHLGYKKHHGRWMTDEQSRAQKADLETQRQANRQWKRDLERWKAWLGQKARRGEARAALAGASDPRAVPMVCQVFGRDAKSQAIAVQLLGQIQAPSSSRALAGLAIFGLNDEVRQSATETLRLRDPREFAYLLIGLFRDPLKYEVRPVGGPGSPGALFVAGRRFNVARLYEPPAIPPIPAIPGGWLAFDGEGYPLIVTAQPYFATQKLLTSQNFSRAEFNNYQPTDPRFAAAVQDFRANEESYLNQAFASRPNANYYLHHDRATFDKNSFFNVSETIDRPRELLTEYPIGRMIAEYQRAALGAQNQLAGDVTAVETYNTDVKRSNARVAQVLRSTSGQDRGEDREGWWEWWVDILGYRYIQTREAPKPTIVQEVPLAYNPQPVPVLRMDIVTGPDTTQVHINPYSHILSCFGAGTPVWTRSGLRPIESLQVGDLVLSQDVKTGELNFQPILVVHHNPPSATLKIRIGDEAIVSSTFHRFWHAGQGWAMARDLKAGDPIRTLQGLAEVAEVAPDQVQPVFNLDVAGNRTFFVGREAALVHDNSVPGLRPSPFDAVVEMTGDKEAQAR